MKNFKFVLLAAFLVSLTYSCTPENQVDEYQTDKEEVCPPNDRNCNGIPDHQE